jgi:hypothetical protein
MHIHTDRWEGFMKYTVEMGSDAVIYVPSFIKTGSGVRGNSGRGAHDTHANTQTVWKSRKAAP